MPLSQRQREYLKLMGIPVWKERSQDGSTANDFTPDEMQSDPVNVEIPEKVAKQMPVPDFTAATIDSHPILPETLKQAVKETFVAPSDVLKREDLPEDWSQMIDTVMNCTRCELHQTRTQAVFGVGDIEADWMIIGEAPGPEEDKKGEPFVGRAGELLTTVLESIGLGRQKVYIANTLKCRPPNNRDPKISEAAQCRAYLEQQIAMVDPKIILCVGRIAAQNLLGTQDPLSRIRGKVHEMIHPSKPEKNIPIIATYHPAYLLRSPSQKRKAWDDLKLAYSLVNK